MTISSSHEHIQETAYAWHRLYLGTLLNATEFAQGPRYLASYAPVTCFRKSCKGRSRSPQSPKNYFLLLLRPLVIESADTETSLFPEPSKGETVLRNKALSFHPVIISYFLQRAGLQMPTEQGWLHRGQRGKCQSLEETRTQCSAHRCPWGCNFTWTTSYDN